MTDGPDDPDLLSVAASISAGGHVEWNRLQQKTPTTGEPDLLRDLRVIDEIARFHRTWGNSGTTPSNPATWSHFTIVEQVGAGAFGAVFRATDEKLQREVALKLLPPAGSDGIDTSRVLKEARLLARVRHANVVAVYGADYIDNRVGIWMELVKGHTLEELLLTHGPFGAREAAVIGLDVCRALAAVHRAGLMHGDVKAHNVMREEGGRTVLMDFGTGKDLTADRSGARPGLGDIAGTPLYLAPEVLEARPRTEAADIYALGVLLYHLVTQAYPSAAPRLRPSRRRMDGANARTFATRGRICRTNSFRSSSAPWRPIPGGDGPAPARSKLSSRDFWEQGPICTRRGARRFGPSRLRD